MQMTHLLMIPSSYITAGMCKKTSNNKKHKHKQLFIDILQMCNALTPRKWIKLLPFPRVEGPKDGF